MLVSHNPAEIIRLASRIVVLDGGCITQDTTPQKFFVTKNEAVIYEIEETHIVAQIGSQFITLPKEKDFSLKVGNRLTLSVQKNTLTTTT